MENTRRNKKKLERNLRFLKSFADEAHVEYEESLLNDLPLFIRKPKHKKERYAFYEFSYILEKGEEKESLAIYARSKEIADELAEGAGESKGFDLVRFDINAPVIQGYSEISISDYESMERQAIEEDSRRRKATYKHPIYQVASYFDDFPEPEILYSGEDLKEAKEALRS
jgi:hypothetical protein